MNYDLHSKMIDALRGVAASAVFFSHSDASHLATNEWLTANRGALGSFGVYVFFCLSGYLIWRSGSRLIGQPGGMKLYAIHRATRLMPLYFVSLFVVLFFVDAIGSKWAPDHDPWVLFRHLVMSQDIYPSVERNINPVLWTLTHETTFYILAALMLVIGFRKPGLILLVSLVFYAVCLVYDIDGYLKFSRVFYAFAFGVFIADAGTRTRLAVCLGTALLTIYFSIDERLTYYVAPMAGIALTLWCLSLSAARTCNRVTSLLMSPPVFLGVISYSLYIWHYQIINVMEYHISFFQAYVPGWSQYAIVRGGVTILICIGFSYLSYLWVEKPSMGSLRRSLERRVGVAPGLSPNKSSPA